MRCALVPHMVFVVDFVARGLGQGISVASHYWVFYGLGAIVGPLVTGHLADRAGFGPALRVSFLVQAIAVLLPAISTSPASLIVSSVVVGAFTPGIVPLVLGRIHELLPHSADAQRAAWGHATTSFALFQAAAAYGFSWLFAHQWRLSAAVLAGRRRGNARARDRPRHGADGGDETSGKSAMTRTSGKPGSRRNMTPLRLHGLSRQFHPEIKSEDSYSFRRRCQTVSIHPFGDRIEVTSADHIPLAAQVQSADETYQPGFKAALDHLVLFSVGPCRAGLRTGSDDRGAGVRDRAG